MVKESQTKGRTCLAASEIIHQKLVNQGGKAIVYSIQGNAYEIRDEAGKNAFSCDQLPIKPPYGYRVFDIIVELLERQGGRARKGMGRNFRLGEGNCTIDTVVGAIGYYYAGKQPGDSVFDPVFVMAAILDWAGIAHNRRGYLELTANYRASRQC
ncbi:MAG TPA: hypothetical protein IAA70_05525 [Candidatus Avoscillospira stercoripullorum]|uniref:Uncharacterized protein n=1 Tax=Candidatus Avoscillospira stercoripullorum TaxID=2840709 RepID=A0A9D1A8N9_9FIRM|nr:hypothetical protein [Candidatus Avoscillospira stercoripullorum]